mmetsp:Transcript_22209/g.71454  ORF Transcript_22209/g.71454 Transcript_22209/m.71454 type:complete len:312 (+) Transcript_22209:212-1147(+)
MASQRGGCKWQLQAEGRTARRAAALLGGHFVRLDAHRRPVSDELGRAVGAFDRHLARARLLLLCRPHDAVALHAKQVAKVDGQEGVAARASGGGDERLLGKDVLGEPDAEEVGGQGSKDDREEGVDVQRPELHLARQEQSAERAGQVEEPLLALVHLHVEPARPVHLARRRLVQHHRRARCLELATERVVLAVREEGLAHDEALVGDEVLDLVLREGRDPRPLELQVRLERLVLGIAQHRLLVVVKGVEAVEVELLLLVEPDAAPLARLHVRQQELVVRRRRARPLLLLHLHPQTARRCQPRRPTHQSAAR